MGFLTTSKNKLLLIAPWGWECNWHKGISCSLIAIYICVTHRGLPPSLNHDLKIFLAKLPRSRDLASDPSARLLGQANAIWDGQKKDHFWPFYTMLAILDNFGRALMFKKTGSFEILELSTCLDQYKNELLILVLILLKLFFLLCWKYSPEHMFVTIFLNFDSLFIVIWYKNLHDLKTNS